jgi:hypothetical protein
MMIRVLKNIPEVVSLCQIFPM